MLLDILATIVAFIAVILLLSLIVTGLTQFTTATLRLRVRNLRRALAILINDLQGGGSKKRDVAPLVENTITVANFGTLQAPKDMIAGLGLVRVSWIPSTELIECLQAAGVKLPPGTSDKALMSFKRLEAYMHKRFTLFARLITFSLALLIAVWFQVSAPELLQRLSTDAELFVMPWREGAAFYAGEGWLGLRWDRVAGVLITALLLTFGAPFWFERLKEVARLRDSVGGRSME